MKFQMVIKVESADLRKVEGVAKKSGKPYCFFEQTAWADIGKAHPVEVKWVVPEVNGQPQPYAVGNYVLDETSVYVDRNGSVQVNMRSLKRVAAAAPSGAAPRAASI
jgi:hypothetical protein